MKLFSPASLLGHLACLLALTPTLAHAQAKAASAGSAPGWGSVWTEPATDQQRKQRELTARIKAAERARDYRAILPLCDQLVALVPDTPAPLIMRAVDHAELKQFDQALADLERGEQLAQKHTRNDWLVRLLIVRSAIHQRMQDYAASAADLQTVLRSDGRNAEALNNLAWLRATSPEAALRNGPESVQLARKAVAASPGPNLYKVTDTLAAAYAEVGDYGRAVESEKRSLALADKLKKNDDDSQKSRREVLARLNLFEQHQAYRAPLTVE